MRLYRQMVDTNGSGFQSGALGKCNLAVVIGAKSPSY